MSSFGRQLRYEPFKSRHVNRPKYSNKSCNCWSKHIHQSILEADYCNELFLLKKAGEITDFKIQEKIEIRVGGRHIANHYVDFTVSKPGGLVEWHEVKGYATELWQLKRRLVEALFPEIPYIVKTERQKIWKR